MIIEKLTNKLTKKMKWYDFSLLKAGVFFFTLFLITACESLRNFILLFEWYWYLIISIILLIPIFKKMINK